MFDLKAPHRRNFWKRLPLHVKFPIQLAVPIMTVVIISMLVSYFTATQGLHDQRLNSFVSLLSERGQAMEDWIEDVNADMEILSKGQSTREALLAFNQAWLFLGGGQRKRCIRFTSRAILIRSVKKTS